jgi:nucleoside-diphosphate-sugar epimerase
MPDCLKAIIDLMNVELDRLKHHCNFNITAFSTSPKELYEEIQKHIPDFKITYKPDNRQEIADSWPKSIDDSIAREEWGWSNDFDLPDMVEDMLKVLKKRYEKGTL